MNTMSEDAKAILLLCGTLGGRSDAPPLEPADYNKVARWLKERNLRPADLLGSVHVPGLAGDTGLAEERLSALLQRGVTLGFAVERWARNGIWVLARCDSDYPLRFKEHLKEKAPPLLFGAGDRSLLAVGGLAIVGSRNVDAEGEAFARDVAGWCARGGYPVVSGGARGVDRIAMKTALGAGGRVVGVLSDSLLRTSVSRDARDALADQRLLLLSPYHPEAGFSAGVAMGRNKLIYAMADYAVVVSAETGKGGTWYGAREELKRPAGRKVFVRLHGTVPPGNRELTRLGALEFPDIAGREDPAALLSEAAADAPRRTDAVQGDLFGQPIRADAVGGRVREAPLSREDARPLPEAGSSPPGSVYEAVLPVLLAALDQPASAADLAKRLDVGRRQLDAWLTRAVIEKKIRKGTRPIRYVREGSALE